MSKNSGKYKTKISNYLYVLSSLFLVAVFYFLLSFVEYAKFFGLNNFILGAIVILIFLCPIFLVPFLYHGVTRTKTIALGKYHGVFILVILLSSLSYACLWLLNPQDSNLTKYLILIPAMLCLVISFMIMLYVNFSIGNRLQLLVSKKVQNLKSFIILLAFIIVLLVYFWLGRNHNFIDMGFIMATIVLLSGLIAYMTTYEGIPQLIKVEVQGKCRPKTIFKNFYNIFMDKQCVLSIFGLLFTAINIIIITINSIFLLGKVFSFSFVIVNISACLLIVYIMYLIFRDLSSKVSYRKRMVLNAISCILSLAATLVLILASLLVLNRLFTSLAFVFCGISFGLSLAVSRAMQKDLKGRLDLTDGRLLNLRNIFICAAIGLTIGLTLFIIALGDIIIGDSLKVILITSISAASSVISFIMYVLRGATYDRVS